MLFAYLSWLAVVRDPSPAVARGSGSDSGSDYGLNSGLVAALDGRDCLPRLKCRVLVRSLAVAVRICVVDRVAGPATTDSCSRHRAVL